MRNKKAQELLDKTIKLNYGDEIPLFKGIYIIQERKLHDSGYGLMTCKEALPIINKAIKDMIDNQEEYKKLNPINGWGTYEGLLKIFQDMRNVCESNPDGVFEIY